MTIEKKNLLVWEDIGDNTGRAKVFGGWIVRSLTDVLITMDEYIGPAPGYEYRESICFVPDINHEWDHDKLSHDCKHEELVNVWNSLNTAIVRKVCKDCGDSVLEFYPS